jgi:hypothetical protein
MASLVIVKAEDLIALDAEGRGQARRAARETPAARRILRMFVDRGAPIPLGDVLAEVRRDGVGDADAALATLDAEDLIRVAAGHVDLAYPFSASPTSFVVRLPDGRERYVCCAVDALGIAPMIGDTVEVSARCRQSDVPLRFVVTPDGPGAESAGTMVWVGKRTEERCRGIDGF